MKNKASPLINLVILRGWIQLVSWFVIFFMEGVDLHDRYADCRQKESL